MDRTAAIITLLASLQLSAPAAVACSCIWQGPFTEVQDETDLVVSGEVVQQKGNSLDLRVTEVLRGSEFRDTVRVWGDTGELCRADVTDFPPGSHWVMALQRIEEVPEGGFNPSTPNFSYGRRGDYSLSRCGVYWLRRTNDLVSGNIAEAGRWQYRDRHKRPVMLSLLKDFLDGELPASALEEAAKPQSETRQLIENTREFLRQQRYESDEN